MSGIFGLFDPAGADSESVLAAASREAWRGRPTVRTDGPMTIGCYGDGLITELTDAMTAVDARTDGPETIGGVLGRSGVGGLAAVLGDFAVAHYERASRTLHLSRDAVGMRSLHWGKQGARIAFASDESVVTALGGATGRLDPRACAP